MITNPNQKEKKIALQNAGSKLITIQSNDMPLNANLNLLGESGWSLGDTPPTAPSKLPSMTVDGLINVLSPSQPNAVNAVEEGVSTLDDASDNSEASTVVNVGAQYQQILSKYLRFEFSKLCHAHRQCDSKMFFQRIHLEILYLPRRRCLKV